MNNDPWKNLASPHAADAISARRVNADIPWGFFWAVGIDHKYLLVLKHAVESAPSGRLPKLKGIEVTESEGNNDGGRMLIFKLVDSVHRDIFHKLCTDIVTRALSATTEKEAVDVALARTWRWHHLLRGGSDGKMSQEEQKGLIGELQILELYLLPRLSALDAMNTWRGPLGAPKDFEIGRICIEAKARRGAATPYVIINSEHQLDENDIIALFLHVIDLSQAPTDTKTGISVTDMARRIQQQIAGDEAAEMMYETLLSAAGFRWEDDYSDSRWVIGNTHLFRVEGDFPRITALMVGSGVSNVKYSILLPECSSYQVDETVLKSALEG